MPLLLNARDYYFMKVAPEERGQNYQQVHQRYLYQRKATKDEMESLGVPSNESDNPILNYKPNLSNDFLIEHHMQELIERTKGNRQIESRLGQTFVAKRKDFHFEAYASHAKDRHSGDLAFFYVGLSDACFQYATLFAELLYLSKLRAELNDDNPLVKRFMQDVSLHTSQLASAQKKWTVHEDFIKLDNKTVLEVEAMNIPQLNNLAVNLAVYTDKFVLGHEVAHHLLGHTGQTNDGIEIIHALPKSCWYWSNATEDHAHEFQADALSICLVAGLVNPHNLHSTEKAQQEYAIQACLGTLLTLTVLGQLAFDIKKSSKTHPSVYDRFEQSRYILKKVAPDYIFKEAEDDILRFQRLLFQSQGHGLGMNSVSLFDKESG